MAGDQAEEEKSRNMVVSSSTTGFCYPDVSSSSNPNNIQTHLLSQIQSFHDSTTTPEIFNLTTGGMDMINNFQHKNNSLQHHHLHHHHQSFFSKHGGNNSTVVPSSSKTAAGGFYDQQHDHDHDQNHLMAAAVAAAAAEANHDQDHSASWQENNNNRLLVDDSSLRCVFTCEGNERPSQGLSLSLSSNNPSSIGLQSFELRQQQHPTIQQDHHHHLHDLRYLSSSSNSRDGFYGKSVNNMIQDHQQAGHHHHQVHLRNSKFLGPAQELLNEFCCLGSKQTDSSPVVKQNKPLVVKTNNNQWEDDQHGSSTSTLNNNASSKKPNLLSSLELIELQKRKAKLLSMLEEVDRRYKHYCDQMKAVVSSFEAVAGNGAAKVYSALASKAMSRHFRCLRDGIVVQIQDTKTAMGEKDPVAPGTTRGETPRLRLLDQTLRQQRALQQMTMMESHPWRPQRGLPERSVSVLRAWLFEHFLHPYPSDVDKHILARQTGLSRSQVSNWFINARVRLWKPMVEEMYLEETKEHLDNINNNNNNMDSSDLPTGLVIDDFRTNQNPNTRGEDQKPTPDELVRIDSECLSSIISTNPDPKNDGKDNNRSALQNHHQHQNQISFGRVASDNTYGAMELDFSSYNHHTGNTVTYDHASHESGHHTFGGGGGGGGGGGVSLTLGLQQHGGSSLGLAFSPASQNSLFYSRDHIIDDCQPVQYSILDGEGQNNLPYRNLLGAQLLHDLAG